MSHQDLIHARSPILKQNVKFVVKDGLGQIKSTRDSVSVMLPRDEADVAHISYDMLASGIKNADNGSKPQIEYLLLRDARRALNERSTRRAALDATTALEISMSRAARYQLSANLDELIVEKLLRKFDGLMKKVELCNILKIDLLYSQDEPDKQVNKHRTNVVHKGLASSHAESGKAIEISTKVIEKISPLSFEIKPTSTKQND